MSDALSIAGIVITVVLGGLGLILAKNVKKQNQNQNVRGGSGIQVGRDIKIDNHNE